MKRLTINAYTASGAQYVVRAECKRRGIRIRNVKATLLPREDWRPDSEVAAYETTDHAGQRNVTYSVTFDVIGAE